MKPIERKHARHYALQAMYQWQMSHTAINDIEIEFLTRHVKRKTDVDYFKELIHEIPNHHIELDQRMSPFLKRALNELDPIELAILRLGTYELEYRLDIPYRVAINEALELTKRFGSIEGYKFVNGVLDQVARQVRQTEINSEKKHVK